MKLLRGDSETFRNLFVLVLFPMSGIYFSVQSGDWGWFARSGASMVAMSILAFGLAHVQRERASLIQMRREIESNEENFLSLIDESVSKYFSAVWGAFAGTVIWGFGDLIGRIDFATLTTG